MTLRGFLPVFRAFRPIPRIGILPAERRSVGGLSYETMKSNVSGANQESTLNFTFGQQVNIVSLRTLVL